MSIAPALKKITCPFASRDRLEGIRREYIGYHIKNPPDREGFNLGYVQLFLVNVLNNFHDAYFLHD